MSSDDQRQPHTLNPSTVHAPRPAYSHVASYTLRGPGKVITIAGQVGIDKETGKAAETFEEQVRIALRNLENCLAAAGATKRDIMKVNHYVVGFDAYSRAPAKQYIEWVGEHRPASTLVPVEKLAAPNWYYEIDCMAIIQGE